ncbi:MAG TPA: tRNA lysidine(34) synthetase TilS [Azoarcus taiwanensis]|nr:tRNA lysidine(34) synthetase TilS [Azoarcus taiwanensis]
MVVSRTATLPEFRLEQTVSEALALARVGAGSRLCVAFSGGVDSVVVLDVLTRLAPRMGFELRAVHVHHGLSAHADAWALFCTRFCEVRGVPLEVFRVSVARDDPDGLEGAARRARHAALGTIETDWLVFGHHLDDQAETVLFRLVRGTGVRGAAGMTAIAPAQGLGAGRLRPLLGCRRRAILEYAKTRGLEWVEDDSNVDLRFARNYLRAVVLPALERGFPGAVDSIGRAAEIFRESEGLLETLAQLDRERCDPDAEGTLALRAVLELADARVFNLLRLEVHARGLAAPSRNRLIETLRQLRSAPDRALHLPLGSAACCAYRGRIWVERSIDQAFEPVAWRGETALAWGSGQVVFERVVGSGVALELLSAARFLRLAPRWEGLAMRAGPGRPRRSLRKLCQDAGLPSWMRSRLPILEVDGEAAWIGGLGVSGDHRCAPGEPGVLPVWRR